MIKITGYDGNTVYINPEKITYIDSKPSENSTTCFIAFEQDGIWVKESPEEFVRKVLEYNENKLSFANGPLHFAKYYKPSMKKLAGLEEQKDE